MILYFKISSTIISTSPFQLFSARIPRILSSSHLTSSSFLCWTEERRDYLALYSTGLHLLSLLAQFLTNVSLLFQNQVSSTTHNLKHIHKNLNQLQNDNNNILKRENENKTKLSDGILANEKVSLYLSSQ
jgi:hypothetical protein